MVISTASSIFPITVNDHTTQLLSPTPRNHPGVLFLPHPSHPIHQQALSDLPQSFEIHPLLILCHQLYSLLNFVLSSDWKPLSLHTTHSYLHSVSIQQESPCTSLYHLMPTSFIQQTCWIPIKCPGTVKGIGDIKKWMGKKPWPWEAHNPDLSTAWGVILERVNRHVNRQ